MTLKQLEAFYWAATCLNFSVAADRVHLSVSSLSKRVAELEASLGVLLFDRSGRSAKLTGQGEQMLPQIRELLRAASQLQESVGLRGLHGRCRVGLGELSGMSWLPLLIEKAAELHPALEIEPYVDIGQVLHQRVEDGELDCVVVAGPSPRGGLASEVVAQVKFVWVASPLLIERAGSDHPHTMMREHTLISLPDGAGSTRILDQWLAEQGTAIHRRLVCNSWSAVAAMVAQGQGFTFLPEQWAQALQARGVLRILPRGGAMKLLQYSVQWRRDDSRALIGEMRDMIKGVIAFTAPRCL